jgi:hypothetical protein
MEEDDKREKKVSHSISDCTWRWTKLFFSLLDPTVLAVVVHGLNTDHVRV